MRLTDKKYWEDGWNNIQLPSVYPNDYAHRVIKEKIVSIIKDNKIKTDRIIELGGCPGRWPYFFNRLFSSTTDVLDYGENNCKLTRENFNLLKIKGSIFNQDLFANNLEKNSYDIVISDGLVEHFTELEEVFYKHLELVHFGGLLIIGVPKVKQSTFYNYFAKKNHESYKGFRIVTKEELLEQAKKYNCEILFCDYLGVMNPGVINWSFIKNKHLKLVMAYFFQFFNYLLKFLNIRRETLLFSPYIYLICKKR